ncbi:MAG: tetratricopeptide repeat protein [Anaerolineae bacterium]|nr:tetratricopeptide repeat protein [Anaerolineae bacterium]
MNVGWQELVILGVILVLLVGAERFVQVMREAGKSVVGFRRELRSEPPPSGNRIHELDHRAPEGADPELVLDQSLVEIQINEETEFLTPMGDIVVRDVIGSKAIAVGHAAQITYIETYNSPMPDLSQYAISPLLVYVISDESLVAERTSARRAIDSLAGLAKPLLVDITPSPLRREQVAADLRRRADICLVIYGKETSHSVKQEQQLVVRHNIKHRYYFADAGLEDGALDDLMQDVGANVVRFAAPEELEELTKGALANCFIDCVRNYRQVGLTRDDLRFLLRWAASIAIGYKLVDVVGEVLARADDEHLLHPVQFPGTELPTRPSDTAEDAPDSDQVEDTQPVDEAVDEQMETPTPKGEGEPELTPGDSPWLLARQYRWKGSEHLAAGEYDQAIAMYSKALELQPNDQRALEGRGQAYRITGQYLNAIADLSQALQLDPDSAIALRHRGDAYRMLGNHRQALRDFDRSLQLAPDSTFALSSRGETHRLLRNHRQALRDFDRSLQLDPDDAFAFRHRGDTYRMMGNYRQALRDLDRSLRLEPHSAFALSSRGATHRLLGNYRQANADLRQALRLDRGDKFAKEQLAMLQNKQKRR